VTESHLRTQAITTFSTMQRKKSILQNSRRHAQIDYGLQSYSSGTLMPGWPQIYDHYNQRTMTVTYFLELWEEAQSARISIVIDRRLRGFQRGDAHAEIFCVVGWPVDWVTRCQIPSHSFWMDHSSSRCSVRVWLGEEGREKSDAR
jgi:hypothetical protein